MTGADGGPEEFQPPTALESAVRALGADTIRYRVDYIMLAMRDGVRLATVAFRPRAEGRYPAILVRSPYAAGIPDKFKPMHTAQFKKNYVLIMQNERGSEWSEGAGMVQPQGGPARVLLDRREPAEGRRHRPSGAACLRADELGRGVGDIPGATAYL